MLLQELQSYRNPRDKLARMVQNKEMHSDYSRTVRNRFLYTRI